MTDYEALYKQSLLQIQKQKDQIKKLEEQIRQRCQSYLIHSSRYKSRRKNIDESGSETKKNSGQSESESQSAAEPAPAQLKMVSNAINMTLQSHEQKQKGVDESTQTNNIFQNDKPDVKSKSGIAIQNEPQSQTKLIKQNSLQNLKSLQSNDSFVSEKSSQQHSQQKILEKESAQPLVNWEEVVSGLKQRMSQIQKQKSDQAQKIIDLQEQIRGYKKEQKQLANANASSMKKKPTKSIQYTNASSEQVDKVELELKKLFESLQSDVNLSEKQSDEEKVKQISNYISGLKKKLAYFQQKYSNGEVQQSKVSQYHYNTPYRKIASKQNQEQDQMQKRDHYEEHQIQVLRNKCKQLQMELTKSREEKFCSPGRNGQQADGQEFSNEAPYLIQEELQKPNSPYVKRSFVRKKVVKRNLSAMILRSPSKSKQESKAAMLSQLQKLKNRLQKSKDGKNQKQVLSLSRKIQKIQKSIEPKAQKIQENSDEDSSIARSSGISQGGFTQIIQVETEGPGFKNYTAHILGLNRKDRSTHEKKKEKNNL